MPDPVWLDDAVVLAPHRDQLHEFGGLAGVRDHGLLASALARRGISGRLDVPGQTLSRWLLP